MSAPHRADALTSALYCHQLVSGFSHQLNVEQVPMSHLVYRRGAVVQRGSVTWPWSHSWLEQAWTWIQASDTRLLPIVPPHLV